MTDYKFDFSPYENIAILPHTSPDGDAIGSAVGMYLYLKKLGKDVVILIDDVVEYKLRFLLDYAEFIDYDEGFKRKSKWDLCVGVDCSDRWRFGRREDLIEGKKLLVIDHHKTNLLFGDYNIVVPDSPATCQIVYLMIKAAGLEVDSEIGTALYTGLLTDTGSFKYPNTQPQTLRIAADLLEVGIDKSRIIFELYQNKRSAALSLETAALSKLEYYDGGRIAMSYVDTAMLNDTGALMSDAGEICDYLREIEGVEIAALLKEQDETGIISTKVSMRALPMHDLTPIAEKFEGGGHKGAAGFTLSCGLDEARRLVLNAISEMGY